MKLSVNIPVYNENATLKILINKVLKSLKDLSPLIEDYEIIVVDDDSKDGSRQVLTQYFSNYPKFKIFMQTVNQGKGAALSVGFAASTGDIVLIRDSDLEYDHEDYTKLIRPILERKADVVYGSWFKGEVTRALYFYHYIGNKLLTFLSNIFTNLNLSDMETCYKAFRGSLIRSMIVDSKRFGVEPEMTEKISKIKGIRVYEVPVSYFGRTYEEGKKIDWKDGVSAIWAIFRYNLFTSFKKSFSQEKLKNLTDPNFIKE